MESKLRSALCTISIALIPFLSHAQTSPVLINPQRGFNNPPVAVNDFMAMCQDAGPVTITVQNNDSDPDGDLLVTAVISGPSNGTASVAGVNIVYTPDPGFYGIDMINYVICDNGIPSMCDTAIVVISVTQAPVADAGPDQTICLGDQTTVGTPAIEGHNYLWTPATGLSATNIAQPFCSPGVTSITYTLTVNSPATGCSNSDQVTITVNPLPPVNAGPDHNICQHDSVQLGTPGTPGNTYYWTPIAPLNNNSIPQPMAHPDSSTTFLLVVTTTATGCYSMDSTFVNVIPGPPANAGPNRTICIGHSVIIGTPAIAGNTYSWTPVIGLSSATAAQPNANPVVTTTYILTVTNTATGCTSSDSVVVFVNPPPLAITGPDRIICSGDSVMIGVPPTIGNTYLWTPATGLSANNISNPYASPTVTTTYTLTESAGVGCSATNSVTITVIPGAVADAGPDITLCTGASTVIGTPAIAGYTYIWAPGLGLSSTVIAQPTASPGSTSIYVLVVTNPLTACIATDSVTVTILNPPIANAGPDQTICNGDSVTIGTAPIAGETYSWSPATGLSAATVAQPNAFPASTTTYTLIVNNAGCSDTDQVVVNVTALPVVNAGADASICPGQSMMLGSPAVAGHTYSWSPATGLSATTVAQPLASPSDTTTYVLTITHTTTGCTNQDSVTINVLPLPEADAGADTTICVGATAVIGTPATSGFSYSWSPATGLSATTTAQPVASPPVTTSYVVTMTNGTSLCQDTDTVTITVVPVPAANPGPDQTICQGDSVMLGSSPVAGNIYSWSPTAGLDSINIANPMAFPGTTTTYILTETAGTGCVSSDSVTVTVIPGPVADAGADTSVCTGSSIMIGTPAITGYTYSWTPATGLSATNIAQPDAGPSVTTQYIVTVHDPVTGCSNTDSITVTVNPLPVASAGPDQTICPGDSITIGLPPTTGYTYSWTPSTGLDTSTTADPMAFPMVTTTYVLTVSAGPGCVSSDSVTITVTDPPVANAGTDQNICSGDTVTIGTVATGSLSYSWSPGTGLSSGTTAQPGANPSATTHYILTVTDPLTGCIGTDTVVVQVNPLPLVDAGADVTMCAGDSVMIGGTAHTSSTYNWSPATGLNSDTLANPYASPLSTTVYLVTEIDSLGCSGTDAVTVTVDSSMHADAGPDVAICQGSSVTIGTLAVLPYTYSWSPAAGLSATGVAQPNASPSITTTYVLTVSLPSGGCTSTDTVTVTVNETPVANAGKDQGICFPDTCTLGATPVIGHTYSWSPAAGLNTTTVSNPQAHPSETTTYVLTVSNGVCSSTDSVVVNVNALPTGLAGSDQLICDGRGALLGREAIANCSYLWSPATNLSSTTVAQPSLVVIDNTTYIVLVNDSVSGCSASDTVDISVQGGGMYNGISPNGDGVNDDWTIPMLDCYSSNTVTILNRWGAEVWKASDYNNQDIKWDGQNLDGESLPDGTYYYVIAYNDTEKRGWVFLKR